MEQTNLYIAGLPEGIDEESFKQLFEGSGTIISCKCVPDKKYGFVKYATQAEAEAVVDAMNGFEFNGTALQVRFASEPTKGGGKGGGKVGGKDAGGGGGGKGNVWGNSNATAMVMNLLQGAAGGQDWGNNAWAQGGQGDDSWGQGGDSWGQGGKGGGGGTGGKGAGGWMKQPEVEADPSANLYIKGLPPQFTNEQAHEVFGAYGTVAQLKLMSYNTDSCILMRMGTVDMATWMVENLNGNIPQGLESAISVRYADNPMSKAKKLAAMANMSQGGDQGEQFFGPAKGMGKGKVMGDSPYGAMGGGGAVQFGNMNSESLPEDVRNAVETVIGNLGGQKKKLIAHSGDESNLYIKDLPGTVDDLYIYKLMSPFGALESVVVKKGESGTWAIAFVKFIDNNGAANAIEGLTNCLLPDGTMPKVSVKVSKPGKGN